ncbi:heavy-metal-associated domain-containing protein [Streptomyces sp. OF3]|uniref:Heavy-metal-associated domain-containing protein n=1 Tax=Streptomyces alkaliterrae TaxID=2213162 RepID=A0A7W3WK88_9ACTN|nr:heavy-metal-associated domain-containing protein [Streptomyces alkaliterrae]MBB1253853.1 heavy-metal-associated domain-containing protein [Streptomyces alkaliterrae]
MTSCCTPDGNRSNGTAAVPPGNERRTVYTVSGMSCGGCAATLTTALGELSGVRTVDVDVETGQVTVVTDGPADDRRISDAVDHAGYELTGRA